MKKAKRQNTRGSKIFRFIFGLILIIAQIAGIILVGYSLILYNGVEMKLKILGMAILIYFLFFFSYLLLRSIKRGKLAFIIPVILSIFVIILEGAIYYYLTKVYQKIDDLSEDIALKYTALVTYDKSLKSEKDLVKKKIGINKDESDYEGNVLALEVIDELKLNKENEIVKFDSTIEELYALKNKEIDAAFFSKNYADMFYTIEGFEDIAEETVILYEKAKEYEHTEEEIKSEGASLDKPFSMLLIGVDSSTDGVTSGYNADVLLLATFNPYTLRATLTSVPRDMYLKTACSNGTYRRINTTTWGSSSSCAVQTVEKMFDVDIDYYAKINFKGVVQLVNAVGGIDVDVDYSICEQNSSRDWGDDTVYVKKGRQHLNGEQALALARNRHKPNDGSKTGKQMGKYCADWTDGSRNDYTRGRNQMKVIVGVAEAATKIKDPNKVVAILDQIKANFQTNVKAKDLLALYNLAKSIVVSDSTNLVNVQRMQLSGYSMWGKIYEKSSKSYPAVTIPYPGSINDIKKEIKANLNNTSASGDKNIKFDLNDLYEDSIIGQGKYSAASIRTLKDVSGYSVSSIKSYASSNNLTLKFIDSSNGSQVNIDDFSNYSFHYQEEHPDIILDQISTLTIYVKKKQTATINTTPTNTDTSTTNNQDNNTNTGTNTGDSSGNSDSTGNNNSGNGNSGNNSSENNNEGNSSSSGSNEGSSSGSSSTTTPDPTPTPTPDPTPEPTPSTNEGE